MPSYTIKMTVDAARIDSVKKALKSAFGDKEIYAVEKNETPTSRAARLSEAEGQVDDARSTVEELKDEMESWRDSIPENLQGGEKYSAVEECIGNLEEIQNALESVEFGSVDFPSMMG